MGEDAYSKNPVTSGAFTVDEWRKGDRVILKKNPNFWQATNVSLDGVEWVSVTDDNTRMRMVQNNELDTAIFVPFSRVDELKKDKNVVIHADPSTREDHLLINHAHGLLAKPEVRQALDMAIDKQSLVKTATYGQGTVAYSYIPKGSLYHYANNLQRPVRPGRGQEIAGRCRRRGFEAELRGQRRQRSRRADCGDHQGSAGQGRRHRQPAKGRPNPKLADAGGR